MSFERRGSGRYSPEEGRKKQKELNGEALLGAAAMLAAGGEGIFALEAQAAHTQHPSHEYVAEAPVQSASADSQDRVHIDRSNGEIHIKVPHPHPHSRQVEHNGERAADADASAQ